MVWETRIFMEIPGYSWLNRGMRIIVEARVIPLLLNLRENDARLLERTISQERWVMHVPLRNGISCKGNARSTHDNLVCLVTYIHERDTFTCTRLHARRRKTREVKAISCPPLPVALCYRSWNDLSQLINTLGRAHFSVPSFKWLNIYMYVYCVNLKYNILVII